MTEARRTGLEAMGKAKEKAEPTPFDRLTDFARKVIRVPKEEVEKPSPKKRRKPRLKPAH